MDNQNKLEQITGLKVGSSYNAYYSHSSIYSRQEFEAKISSLERGNENTIIVHYIDDRGDQYNTLYKIDTKRFGCPISYMEFTSIT